MGGAGKELGGVRVWAWSGLLSSWLLGTRTRMVLVTGREQSVGWHDEPAILGQTLIAASQRVGLVVVVIIGGGGYVGGGYLLLTDGPDDTIRISSGPMRTIRTTRTTRIRVVGGGGYLEGWWS